MTNTAIDEVLPQSGNRSKVEHYGWTVKDTPGQFIWLNKDLLNVDPSYQRDSVGREKVLNIARDFCWASFGTLSVARRPDGSLWVFDGQHRKLGADKRSDIQKVPCMVYLTEQSNTEADLYLQTNVSRTGIPSAEKFKAMVHRGDADAVAVKAMVEKSDYTVSKGGTGRKTICCIMALLAAYQQNREVAEDMWQIAIALHDGEKINDRILLGLIYLEEALRDAKPEGNESLLLPHNARSLASGNMYILKNWIDRAAVAYAKGGKKVYARGILNFLNQRRRSREIPEDVLGGSADDRSE